MSDVEVISLDDDDVVVTTSAPPALVDTPPPMKRVKIEPVKIASPIKSSANGGTLATNGSAKNGQETNGHQQTPENPTPAKIGMPAVAVSIFGLVESIRGKVKKDELEKIQKKLDKRKESMDDLNNLKLANFVDEKAESIRNKPNLVFRFLKDVLDELSRYGQKKDKNGKSVSMSNDKDSTNTPSKSTAAVAPSSGQTRDESDEKRKIAKQEVHIKKLEKALRQCGRKIQELDEAEIDLDGLEDENSPYMMKTRYEKRYMALYRKIAELKKQNASLKRKCDKRVKIETSQIPEVNAKIEELINKKRHFPDFADILGFYKTVNEDRSLGMSKDMLHHDAKQTFISVGKILKSRRVHDYHDTMESYFSVGGSAGSDDVERVEDPADADQDLNSRLNSQSEEGKKKMDQLLDDFTRKQIEIKEEAEPVSDNEPEDKPSEDEEEEEDPLPDDPIPDPDQPQEPDGIAQATEDPGSKEAAEENQKVEEDEEVNPAVEDEESSSDSSSEGEDDNDEEGQE